MARDPVPLIFSIFKDILEISQKSRFRFIVIIIEWACTVYITLTRPLRMDSTEKTLEISPVTLVVDD